jgi:hypothetical protein
VESTVQQPLSNGLHYAGHHQIAFQSPLRKEALESPEAKASGHF